MRKRSDLHLYQNMMHQHILDNYFAGLFLGMSLGKTVTCLAAIDTLLQWCEISKPLIVAPRLVAEKTWSDEIQEWDFLNHLRISKVIGTSGQRKKALVAEADIWIISRDNLAWLVDLCGPMWPFDMVILDESTSFKNHQSLRFRKMKEAMKHGKITRLIELTGTPVPNGLMDLWAQMYLLDKGERLGTTIEGYRNRYFTKNDYEHKYALRAGAEESIHEKVRDICASMRKEDWLELKPVENVTRSIYLPNMAEYNKFKEEAVLQLPEDEITAVNAAALYSKLLQFCNGAVYDQNREYHVIHDAKLDMLEEIIETLNGTPVIVFYCFRSDIERIKLRIKNVVKLDSTKEIDRWNAGEIEVLLAHPASAGHGLNLQHGGRHIIWFGVPSALELYQQAVARLDRQGQTQSVINMHLITKGTIEETVVSRLIDKTLTQETLIDALRAFKDEAKRYKQVAQIEDEWLYS